MLAIAHVDEAVIVSVLVLVDKVVMVLIDKAVMVLVVKAVVVNVTVFISHSVGEH